MSDLLILVTVDTEQDCTATWQAQVPLAFRSVHTGIVRRLQPLCEALDVKPTYLLSPSVMEDEAAAVALASLAPAAELALHLHGEYVEPRRTYSADRAGATDDLACHYPRWLEAAKLKSATQLFSDTFGYLPRSYRAGRFAADMQTLSTLAHLGYSVDSSATPHVRWRDSRGEVDHRSAPQQPCYVAVRPDGSGGVAKILEVPVSIAPRGDLRRRRYAPARILVRRCPALQSRVGAPLWLRPSFSTERDLRAVADWHIDRFKHAPVICLNLMFHSVELTDGTSPYSSSLEEAERILGRVRSILAYVRALGGSSETLSGVAASAPWPTWKAQG